MAAGRRTGRRKAKAEPEKEKEEDDVLVIEDDEDEEETGSVRRRSPRVQMNKTRKARQSQVATTPAPSSSSTVAPRRSPRRKPRSKETPAQQLRKATARTSFVGSDDDDDDGDDDDEDDVWEPDVDEEASSSSSNSPSNSDSDFDDLLSSPTVVKPTPPPPPPEPQPTKRAKRTAARRRNARGDGAAGRASTPAASSGTSSASASQQRRKVGRKKKETLDERIHRLHPEIKEVWTTLRGIDPSTELDIPEQPENLAVTLLPFQREGLAWMINQESNSDFQGGILADEMGMGKTIQTIALLLSRPSQAEPRKPTLVIAPTVALFQWRTEVEAKSKPGSLKVLVYYGSGRNRDADHITSFDVVLTTYATVESEWRRQQSGFKRKGEKVKEKSTIHSIAWHRVVLDEAHFIKDRSCSTARAVFGLSAKYKWSLSGTPLQNRVGEMYSLVKFLKGDPFSFYFCRQCECKSLTWNFSNYKRCDDCGHANCSHFAWWNREILRPIQKFGPVGAGKVAFDHLRQLLSAIMLRRTKVDRGSELGLPPRIIHTRRDLFTHEEEDFYEALFSESKTRFQSFVRAGTVLNNYAHIFELLMRMRQSVNHPWLVTHRVDSKDDKDVCGICHEFAEDPIMSGCKHTFCREEVELYISSSCAEVPVCPVCFQPLSIDLTQPTIERPKIAEKSKSKSIVRRLDMERWQSSTKIEALLEELTALQSDTHCIKSIIFSQFTQFLDLLEWRLQRGGIRCVKLDGRMSPASRAAVIDAFNTKPEITVFLISLKAGGLALNLTAASRVYITDPWWNPCAEAQAMDRIHRLGQNRPVEVRRLIIENSIESRIDQLQEKKRLLFESTVGMNSSALNRLTEEDLRFLFVL
ncbi:nucleotide excision repair protein [Salpingoeca rosetta]|uniref:Nucleotide excision repair protein n=1 Tax=Salpingoeca rosetta (strain ATCC 50818 / BSB-021) TaxID=946362 RepID=F2U9T1_SALR5|nr:nucleotide excision repair protein [Salpingoeca rosetta]EGD73108.1 nucleotide excision repair protein [Salpingoeca rosetta]|eukprot:XP_004994139.1 nucleotide excision repair protein [Salpingoeca rosetta]